MSLILSGTDGLSDVDGTAATPAIRGTDANTGIFFPAADTIAFAEGGAEVARFDSSGNFGIGTASPAAKLNVVGSSTILKNGGTGATAGLLLSGGGASTNFNIDYGTVASNRLYFRQNYFDGSGHITFQYSSDGTMASPIDVLAIKYGGGIAVTGLTDISAATSGQIQFPATQNASANANTLDDYEEGSWTPALTGTTAVSYANQVGRYTKIGRLVTIQFVLQTNSQTYTSTGATFAISGLPFAGTFPGYTAGDGVANLYSITFTGYVLCSVNSSSLNLTQIQSATAFSSLTNAAALPGFIISGTISYITT